MDACILSVDRTTPPAANMNSTPSSRSESVVWPSLATASILQVRQLANELRELRRKGESSPIRLVLERHPELAEEKSVVIELANEDLCQRSEAGESLDLNEYCKQLPIFQEEVRRMALAHGFVEGAADHYGESITFDHLQCMHKGADRCVFRIGFS